MKVLLVNEENYKWLINLNSISKINQLETVTLTDGRTVVYTDLLQDLETWDLYRTLLTKLEEIEISDDMIMKQECVMP